MLKTNIFLGFEQAVENSKFCNSVISRKNDAVFEKLNYMKNQMLLLSGPRFVEITVIMVEFLSVHMLLTPV